LAASCVSRRVVQPTRLIAGVFGFCLFSMLPASTETAIANGDTRTLHLYHAHTGESIDATYLVDGHYDPAVLKKLNWFLRDWRRNEETNMDPRLFDAVWETYRSAGADDRIVVLCGYRSPQTNAMLRRRSRRVAEHSQHMLGKAMDTTMPSMSMETIREDAMRLQMGGVGYYPSSNFVHIDVGGVRAWPRMSYDQLVRLFPDGKTVHIAADGRTLPGYDEARAEIEADGGTANVPPPAQGGNIFAWLFSGLGGGGEDEHEDIAGTAATPTPAAAESEMADAGKAADEPIAATAGGEPGNADGDQATAADQAAVSTQLEKTADISADNNTPLPPRRPVNLASLGDDVPLPQLRSDTQTAMIEAPAAPQAETPAPELPGIITQGPSDGGTAQSLTRSQPQSPSQILAYAPLARMEGLRSAAHEKADARRAGPAILPARLDRSNFRSLTEATETAEMESQTIFGPTLAGLRRAARVEAAALSDTLESGYLARFGADATELAADHFAGPSVASLDSDKTLVVGDASELRPGD
jgi:uncharacterized protein YcbK (DUF882 family)